MFAQGFRPNRNLGQNFLTDLNVREKIISSLPLSPGRTVVEIGPGFGMMTTRLADMSKKVIAVEKDQKLAGTLEVLLKDKTNVKVIPADILDIDLANIAGEENCKIFVYGNIPYNITSPIIQRMIVNRENITGLYIVIQEEVADRLSAAPGSRKYGSISCYVGYYARVSKLFKISRNCFFPKPKVNSCLVSISFDDSPGISVLDEELMFSIIRKAFSQRRKKILNPLSARSFLGFGRDEWDNLLHLSGVDPSSRAEALSLRDYARITDEVYKKMKTPRDS